MAVNIYQIINSQANAKQRPDETSRTAPADRDSNSRQQTQAADKLNSNVREVPAVHAPGELLQYGDT